MKKTLLSVGLLALAINAKAQFLSSVGDGAVMHIGKNALVYNGGGLQIKSGGFVENHGNVMLVGSGSDFFKTLNASGNDKTEAEAVAKVGGQFVNVLNEPAGYAGKNNTASGDVFTYGQLYITGFPQSNLTGYVNQEHRNVNHGDFQQMALPFYDKTLSTLSTDLGKTFSTVRWSKNEILKYNNPLVVFDHYTSLATKLSDPTGYYILGNNNNTLNVSTVTRTVVGRPYADGNQLIINLQNAGNGINWNGGGAINGYNEKYNTYVQDGFEMAMGGKAWEGNFGRNMYQFGNPFLTNIDLRNIFINEGASGDGVYLTNIYGIRVEQAAGTVSYQQNVGGGASAARYITWDTVNNIPVGDVNWLIVRPMSVFTIKLKDNATAQTLDFNNLRRFNYIPRTATTYSVTTASVAPNSITAPTLQAKSVSTNIVLPSSSNSGRSTTNSNSAYSSSATAATSSVYTSSTVKQLGIIALDGNGAEIGRAYYVVSPNGTSGHSSNSTLQVASSTSDIIGTFEEDGVKGGYDNNYTSSYWLYINETNESFQGKEVPMALYDSKIKALKFEIRENAELVQTDTHLLSSGIGFYYKLENGTIQPASQDHTVPVTVATKGSDVALYYGAPSGTLNTVNLVTPSRTKVALNSSTSEYVIFFDPNWKKADVRIFDLTGKLILEKKNIQTSTPYPIPLNTNNVRSTYIVNVISDGGEVVNTKIIK